MKLGLVKIEEGICRGNVVHHEFIKRTPAEIKKQLDGVKNKRELKEKRKREQDENVRKKAEKRGEITVQDESKEKDANVEDCADEGDDFKDEGQDQRVLGKRGRNEVSDNRTGRTDKKALMKSKNFGERKASKSSPSSPKTQAAKKSSRPNTKEARLKRLGKYVDTKPDNNKKGSFGKSSNRPKPSGTPTFKRQKK